jgi:hypothetical protein
VVGDFLFTWASAQKGVMQKPTNKIFQKIETTASVSKATNQGNDDNGFDRARAYQALISGLVRKYAKSEIKETK